MENYIKVNQKGFIEVSKILIENNSKDILNFFSNIIPLEVLELKEKIITYKCLCKDFRGLNIGETIPYYDCVYDSLTGKCTFTERR